MDQLVKLANDSIKYYLDNKRYLTDYDSSLKKNNNGAIVIVNRDDKTELSGSIYPTRSNIGLDVIHEAVNVAIFNNAIDLTDGKVDQLNIMVYEITKIKQIQYVQEFGMYHGLLLKYNNNSTLVFRNDYESDYQMFEDAIKKANVDSHDVFTLEKFKVKKHI
jgi:hypothetical protein